MSGKKPLTIFRETLNRSRSLLDMVDEGGIITNADDIVRGAVIIGVAAFDRYFTSKFCDVLVPHLKKSSKNSDGLLNLLEQSGLDTEFALQLVISKRPFRKIRTIVQNSLSRHTTHRSSTIDELFVSLGLKKLTENAQARAKRVNLESRIQKLVDIRNEIAHEAHVNSYGNAKAINSEDVRSRIDDVELFVENCDHIIDNAFKRKTRVSA